MGEVEIIYRQKEIIIHSVFFFYGNAADDTLSRQIAADISSHWNEPAATIRIKGDAYRVYFNISGHFTPLLTPQEVIENTNPRHNYFRVENYAHCHISYVDDIGCNTGYLLVDNILDNSTTAAHEYGHTLGLVHPGMLDIRGKGVPGIMYPRGTITDPQYQYSSLALPLEPGGTMNPFSRKVLPQDVNALQLHKLRYNKNGFAIIGEFSSVWHDAEVK